MDPHVARENIRSHHDEKVIQKLEAVLDKTQLCSLANGIDALLGREHEAVRLMHIQNAFQREWLQA